MIEILLKPFVLIYQIFQRVYLSALNGRCHLQYVCNFWINFLPISIWIFVFKNAGIIPNSIRPSTFVKLAMNWDNYIFNLRESLLTSILALFILVLTSYVLYFKFYKSFDYQSNDSKDTKQCFQLIDLESDVTEQFDDNFNEKIIQCIKQDRMHRPFNCWYLSPPILLGSCWFILNFAYWLREPINTPKDLIAWFSYVVCHLFVPICTALWLYFFHPPGALKLFSYGIGIQNIAGVLTHLCFPNAPPWFIHYYGENYEADYDILGYAAGLTRVDIALGTYIYTNGFHSSPIVFGALPSIHSAMATIVFFFCQLLFSLNLLKTRCFRFCYFTMVGNDLFGSSLAIRFDVMINLFHNFIHNIDLLEEWFQ